MNYKSGFRKEHTIIKIRKSIYQNVQKKENRILGNINIIVVFGKN